MQVKSSILLSMSLIFSGIISAMEAPGDQVVQQMNMLRVPVSLQNQVKNQATRKLADQIYVSLGRNLFCEPNISGLITGVLVALPPQLHSELYQKTALEVYSRLVKDYSNRKSFFNHRKNNLIKQVQAEDELPEKVIHIFSRDLYANKSYSDEVKFHLNPNDSLQGLLASCKVATDVEMLKLAGFFQGVAVGTGFLALPALYLFKKYLEPEGYNVVDDSVFLSDLLFDVLANVYNDFHFRTTALFGSIVFLRCFILRDNNLIEGYNQPQLKRFQWQYPLGVMAGVISIGASLYYFSPVGIILDVAEELFAVHYRSPN